MTIVVFGDYECPFCRRVEGALRAIREEYPDRVAVVYRDLPLPIHEDAYRAARFAQCAADQGWFEPVHRVLSDSADPGVTDPAILATAVSLPDPILFAECASRTDTDSRIEEYLVLAKELGIDAVPAIILEGVLLGPPPDSLTLFTLVRRYLIQKAAGNG